MLTCLKKIELPLEDVPRMGSWPAAGRNSWSNYRVESGIVGFKIWSIWLSKPPRDLVVVLPSGKMAILCIHNPIVVDSELHPHIKVFNANDSIL